MLRRLRPRLSPRSMCGTDTAVVGGGPVYRLNMDQFLQGSKGAASSSTQREWVGKMLASPDRPHVGQIVFGLSHRVNPHAWHSALSEENLVVIADMVVLDATDGKITTDCGRTVLQELMKRGDETMPDAASVLSPNQFQHVLAAEVALAAHDKNLLNGCHLIRKMYDAGVPVTHKVYAPVLHLIRTMPASDAGEFKKLINDKESNYAKFFLRILLPFLVDSLVLLFHAYRPYFLAAAGLVVLFINDRLSGWRESIKNAARPGTTGVPIPGEAADTFSSVSRMIVEPVKMPSASELTREHK